MSESLTSSSFLTTQLNPVKRRGNRRYYQKHEVVLIRRIRKLLYDEGFTINGARSRLSLPYHEANSTIDDPLHVKHIDMREAITDIIDFLRK